MAKSLKPRGRPSKHTPALADEIVQRLSKGEPLAAICRDDHMPCPSVVWEWRAKDTAFSDAIARARDTGFDVIAARTRQTARGKTEAAGGDSSGDVQRDKLIIDTDLKLLAKWDPKRYGDKVQHVGGDDGDAPIAHSLTVKFIKPGLGD